VHGTAPALGDAVVILVVEDEAIVALLLEMALSEVLTDAASLAG
jgi:hypothetical protein